MRWPLALFSSFALIAAAACGGTSTAPAAGCVVGASAGCQCTDGRSGAQVCQADHTLGQCTCTGGPASGLDASDGSTNLSDGGPGALDANGDATIDSTGEASADPCTKCLKFSVPLTTPTDAAEIFVMLPKLTDMSASTINYRVQVVSARAGGILVFPLDGPADNYAGDYQWTDIRTLVPGTGAWQTISLDVGSYVVDADAGRTFDKTQVDSIRFQIAGDGTSTALANPTVVYIDEITVSDGVAGPYTFDTGLMGFHINPSPGTPPKAPPPGTSLTWIGP